MRIRLNGSQSLEKLGMPDNAGVQFLALAAKNRWVHKTSHFVSISCESAFNEKLPKPGINFGSSLGQPRRTSRSISQ